jgi:hypothetical protein
MIKEVTIYDQRSHENVVVHMNISSSNNRFMLVGEL